MDKTEASLIAGVIMAGLIGLAKLLDSEEKITWRKAVGRAVVSCGLGAAGGLVLVLVPSVHPTVIIALACAFASLGTSAFEVIMKNRLGTPQ